MKISASVYASDRKDLEKTVKALERISIDYFHIDCNDDLSVFNDIALIRKISKTPIDLHIISAEPEKFFPAVQEHAVDLVTLQYENLTRKPMIPKGLSSAFGLAITTHTNIEVFEDYRDDCAFILFMTSTPGQSRGKFNEKNFQKIRLFRDQYPDKLIHVDGGVDEEVSFILRHLGVYCAVSGSYLLNSEAIENSIIRLKSGKGRLHFPVSSFMKKPNELAIIPEKDLDILEVLNKITQSKMGFCLIVDDGFTLKGLITDGDIRRALIENGDDFNRIRSFRFINSAPFAINDQDTIQSMLEKISRQPKNINFVPVVNNRKQLVGAISFHNLIKGEL